MNSKGINKRIIFLAVIFGYVLIKGDNDAFMSLGFFAPYVFFIGIYYWYELQKKVIAKGEALYQLKQIKIKEHDQDLDSTEVSKKIKINKEINCLNSEIDSYLMNGFIFIILHIVLVLLN